MIEQKHRKNKHVGSQELFSMKVQPFVFDCKVFLFMSNEILRSPMSLEQNP